MKIITSKPVAFDSPDHLYPHGTKQDRTKHLRFIAKCMSFMKLNNFGSILDLGCSGGDFIAEMNHVGFLAIGVEGSDYSKNTHRAAWGFLKDICLFTSDITVPFHFEDNTSSGKLVTFDIITAFEVLEHLTQDGVDALFENINTRLAHDETVFILSVSTEDDVVGGVNLHQCVHKKDWWFNKFQHHGWHQNTKIMKYFNGQYNRGNKLEQPKSFPIILTKKVPSVHAVPSLTVQGRILDAYYRSWLHKSLYILVRGSPNHY